MTDEKWLREGLADAVPEAPHAPDRARAARERGTRARRRTTALGLAGAVAVVAAVAGTAIAFDRSPDHGTAGPTTAKETRSPYDAPACPPEPRPIPGHHDPLDRPRPGQPDAVPEGATSVRLCQGEGTSFDVPNDALVDNDVASLVEEVNGLRKTGAPDTCIDSYGPAYRLQFGYADGSTFVVSGKLYGCNELIVGSGYRSDATVPWQSFVKLLRGQREMSDPIAGSDSAGSPACTDTASSPIAVPADITRAVYCAGTGIKDKPVPISSDDLSVLVADMAANTGSESSGSSSSGVSSASSSGSGSCGRQSAIVALTSWGDHLVLGGTCDQYAIDGDTTWTPGPEAQQILDDLSRRAR